MEEDDPGDERGARIMNDMEIMYGDVCPVIVAGDARQNKSEKVMQRKTISPYDITSSDNPGSKGRGGVKENVVQASTTEVMGNSIISDSDKTAITGLSNEKWETLRTLLNGANMGTSEKMTGCPVGLPNGNQIAATKEGTMVFD
ncbi:hypothetical protein V6N11_058268 [Hibiscus sabdariffa]|uniref:Uncharacterized protein n=1 Tax=Hibiscus sabdariffa TaxID=183260 RepID=A0ABR2A2J2_9ROSI